MPKKAFLVFPLRTALNSAKFDISAPHFQAEIQYTTNRRKVCQDLKIPQKVKTPNISYWCRDTLYCEVI
jgi:hypothetical protein